MKKILEISLLSLGLLSTANAAIFDKSGVFFTAGTFQFDKMDAGLSVGMNVKGEKEIFENFYVGAGINAEIFDPGGTVNDMNDDLGEVVDIYPTLSYELVDAISLTTMYGYTVGQVGSETFDGTTYGFGVDFKLSNKWTLTTNYKVSDLTFTRGNVQIDAERLNAGFSYKF